MNPGTVLKDEETEAAEFLFQEATECIEKATEENAVIYQEGHWISEYRHKY